MSKRVPTVQIANKKIAIYSKIDDLLALNYKLGRKHPITRGEGSYVDTALSNMKKIIKDKCDRADGVKGHDGMFDLS
jgi:hypothetical protein